MAPLADVAEDEVERLLAVNYKGTLWGIQAASKVLTNGGVIINLSSVTVRLALPNLGAYAATKAAVDVLTKTAAKELGGRGIRVNSVAPGVTVTDMTGTIDDQTSAALKAQILLGNRFGQPEEVAHVVAFLASPQASWVTGQNPELAGGQ